MATQAVRKFYSQVSVEAHGAGFAVMLDGKPIKNGRSDVLEIARKAIAEAVAEEWRGQDDRINLAGMYLTRLVSSAAIMTEAEATTQRQELMAYIGTDLLCYRGEDKALAARQASEWDPVLAWTQKTYGLKLEVTVGLMPIAQPQATLDGVKRILDAMNPERLVAFSVLVRALGSMVLALAVMNGKLNIGQAIDCSRVDEFFQADQWGIDDAAARRWQAVDGELRAAARYLELLNQSSAN